MRVVFRSPVLRPQLSALAEAHGVELAVVEDAVALHREAANADAVWLWPTYYDAALVPVLEQYTPRLGWLQLVTMGYDQVQEHGAASGVTIANVGDAYAPTVAEHAVALLLALLRRIPEAVRSGTEHRWDAGHAGRIGTLNEATVAVVGFGNIGRAVAVRLRALGAHVVAVTRSGSPDPLADESVAVMRLADLLPRCDAVVLACPLTPETRGLIGIRALGALPARAVLVNIARGPVVDQAALVQALQEGRLAGAGLDVTDPEPLPPDDPLWSAPNALITPHVAGYGADVPARRALALIETNLRRYLAGEPLTSVVPVPPRTERPMST
ncbi:MAG: NAD(P)-dependent oxidoreductase [Vulcanimicrobiaceae bacterium]|jgi:phosphoglycerate dehydrogenase-like enzyme